MTDPLRDAAENVTKAYKLGFNYCVPTEDVDALRDALSTPPPAADAELVEALEEMRPALEAATESWTSKADGDSIFIWKRCSNIPGRDVGISLRMITDLLAAFTKHSAPEAGEHDNG